jgi:ankyrin repeat protein
VKEKKITKAQKQEKVKLTTTGLVKTQRVLVPNPDLKIITKNIILNSEKSKSEYPDKNVSLICNNREPIYYVCKGDIKGLKNLIKSPEEISTLFQPYSVGIHKNALNFAIEKDKSEFVSLLMSQLQKESKDWNKLKYAEPEHIDLSFGDSGKQNNYQFGFKTRKITMSRGGREGNMALTSDSKLTATRGNLESLLKSNLPLKYVEEFLNKELISKHFLKNHLKKFVRSGNYEVVRLLFEKNKDTIPGYSVVHLEVLRETGEPLRVLISSVTKKIHPEEITPLHIACINPNILPLKKLLSVAPTLGIHDVDGFDPIHYAAACVKEEPLKYLITKRIANLTAVSKKLITPLMIACKYGREHNVKLLLEESKRIMEEAAEGDNLGGNTVGNNNSYDLIDAKTKHRKTAVHYAIKIGNVSILKMLFDAKANLNMLSSKGKTPLMIAATMGYLDCVKFLIEEAKVNPLTRNKKGKTAATFAVINGHLHVLSYLLRIGVDPNG